jgi:DNA-binding NarL/FixJ family response regulator
LLVVSLFVQSAAAIYFIVDGVDDALNQFRRGVGLELAMECVVALALLLAVIVSARQLRLTLAQGRRQLAALDVARGSMAQLLDAKFDEWGLSPGECEVALFALKGCTITEIASARRAAEGTVRSQLSQVYAKAGVTSQATLIGQFVEDLL